MRRWTVLALLALTCGSAIAEEDPAFEWHAQATYVRQYKPSFKALYSGPNSLIPQKEYGYTFTSSVFLAARFKTTEFYFNPDFVSGAPLSSLHGLGGFSNGENQRGTGSTIRAYAARMFVRQTWNLGGQAEEQDSQQNQVRTSYAANRAVLTVGKMSILDVFDVLDYSHEPRTQFMNWASLTYGAWDYPADARGYTWGAAFEYITAAWQVRLGRFLVPKESNGLPLDWAWRERYGDAFEFEVPYTLLGRKAVARALAFDNHVNAGSYADAIAAGSPPDVSLVRRVQAKRGFGLSTQVELSEILGIYTRAGWSDGRTETFMFTEIDRSLSAGALLKGTLWQRAQDTAGIAAYVNGLSQSHRQYLELGGLGFFLGDGALNYGTERIAETFYSFQVAKGISLSPGYQRVWNPGYNRDRGPVDIFAIRLHAEI